MRRPTIAAVGVLGIVSAGSADTLLTLPQRDRVRLRPGQASVSVSADGKYIAFASYARLAPEDTNNRSDIYILERESGSLSLQSRSVGDQPAAADCTYPRISGDGRFVVFETITNSVEKTSRMMDIVLRDRVTQTSRWLSRPADGRAPDGWSANATINDDGTVVAFESSATNLVAEPDVNGALPDIYLADVATAVMRRVSVDDTNTQIASSSSVGPSISGDGRYVAFTSTAKIGSGLLPARNPRAPPRPTAHVYLRDTKLNRTHRIMASGIEPNGPSLNPVVSRDGQYVAFVSEASNLLPKDENRAADVFLYSTATGSITLVSRNAAGRPANGASGAPAISADGRFVAFQSEASDLVCTARCAPGAEDINLLSDVFTFDRVSGSVTRISADDGGGWMEESGAPALDARGAIVAFTSRHPIDENDAAHDFDLFVHVSSLIR